MEERGRGITGTTGILACSDIRSDHSRSPQIHNAAFEAQGLDLGYVAFDVCPPSSRRRLPVCGRWGSGGERNGASQGSRPSPP